MSSPLPVPGPNAGVSELLQAGTRLFRVALPKCLPMAMVAALISQIPGLLLEAQGQQLKILSRRRIRSSGSSTESQWYS